MKSSLSWQFESFNTLTAWLTSSWK